jgi:isoleucyl-tRNA synthetase
MKKPKYTVNLPKTNFPMKADLPIREPGFLSLWEKNNVYAKMIERGEKQSGETFVLHDGPPYANGHIHMGHALNKILKDVIVKYQAMRGRILPYIPGWDCHGLPIEHQLMKEKGWDKRKISRTAFRQEAARYAEHFVGVQRSEFKRLGIFGDWEKPYKTLSPDYEAAIVRSFHELYEKGFIYRDKKPVYWCASCETALAEAEVEYEEKTSPSIFVKFPIKEWPNNEDAQKMAKAAGKRAFVLVWTTTPWTLPANVALAFHPEQTYRLYESEKTQEKYLVGNPGWDVLVEALGPGCAEAPSIDGLSLEGLLAKNPINNNDSQGVLAEFVSSEEGTGVVHIAPGHGQEDYGVGREYGLPTLSPVDDSGKFSPDVLPNTLAGKSVWDANQTIIDLLDRARLLLKAVKITHSYPHCWRCKNPILFRATEQWFLRVDDAFRAKLIASVDEVTWTPDYGKERILGMLKSRPDWCLARQRYWGTPIAMFYCEKCKEPLKDSKVFKHVEELFRKHGSNVWFEKEAKALLPEGTACGKCRHAAFKKEEDILDVWFDSGVSWAAVLRDRLGVMERKNVMYLEGSDQHRGWFQTSLLPAMALTGAPPYDQVLTHGFVVDGEGRKMSKSLGNVIAPQEVLEKYGADLLRLWVAMSDYREDVRLSQDILDRVIDTYRKIRNTLRYLLGNLGDFNPKEHSVPFEKMEEIDKGAVALFRSLAREVRKQYDAHSFHAVSTKICHSFCINALSGFYLDVLKDVLYCDRPDSPRRRSAQTAFLEITKGLSRLLAPLLSFTAEEVWQSLKEQNLLSDSDVPESVFLNGLPQIRDEKDEKTSLDLFEQIQNLRQLLNDAIEKKRQSGEIKGLNDTFAEIRAAESTQILPLTAKLPGYLGIAKAAISKNDSDGFQVTQVAKAPGQKCDRCWLWKEDVNAENLCGRCADAEKALAAPAK